MAAFGLWLTYAAAAGLSVGLARRYAASFSRRAGIALALLPLVFTGRAMLTGGIYGPSDLIYGGDPWKRLAEARTVGPPRNPILSDLAFANIPWRAAVREAFANGRAPLWNRFVLGGNPLIGAAQAGVFHPSTILGVGLPLGPSWTFSCTLTLFLALLSAFVFLRDDGMGETACLVGAVGWGFSTYVVFWNGWSVGPSTATFPLLLLGLRRLARKPDRRGIGLTAAALGLSVFGGHPESLFHSAAAGGAFLLWELAARRGRRVARALGGAIAAGALALLLTGPQLFPLLEALPHSAEYRLRATARSASGAGQSVPARESLSRLLPDVLPFAHGIWGRSAVDEARGDGSGMPLGYAGALLFPLSILAFAPGSRRNGRTVFLLFSLAGFAYGASAPGLLDLTSHLPGFDLALNYRLVFLAGFGLSGLAALGAESLAGAAAARRLASASVAVAALLLAARMAASAVFADRGLDPDFVRTEFLIEIVPVLLLAAMAFAARERPALVAVAALVALVGQRFLEMRDTYPTLPAGSVAPALPTLAALPLGSEPARFVAAGDGFRPNASALYGIEDARGYESLVLDRFADTFPLWSTPRAASFNRVDDLSRPFLGFLNVRYALGAPDASVPPGWVEQARGPDLAIFSNPRALPRVFVPRTIRTTRDAMTAMASVEDLSQIAFLEGDDAPERANGHAELRVREVGPDLVVGVTAESPVLVATSLPDWPGWVVEGGGRCLPTVTVDHAFVGFRADAGVTAVRLRYAPRSWRLGLWALVAGIAAASGLAISARRRSA